MTIDHTIGNGERSTNTADCVLLSSGDGLIVFIVEDDASTGNGSVLGVLGTNDFALDFTLDSLGINRGGLGDGEGSGVGLPSQSVGAVHSGCTLGNVGDLYHEAVVKVLSGRQSGSGYGLNDLATNGHVNLSGTNLLVSGEGYGFSIAIPNTGRGVETIESIEVAGGVTASASECNLGDVANSR